MVFFLTLKIKNVSEVYLSIALQFSSSPLPAVRPNQFSDFDPVNQLLSAKISFPD